MVLAAALQTRGDSAMSTEAPGQSFVCAAYREACSGTLSCIHTFSSKKPRADTKEWAEVEQEAIHPEETS